MTIQELQERVEWLVTQVKEISSLSQNLKSDARPKDCADVLNSGINTSGVNTIHPLDDRGSMEVFCDMETDSGGWTVIQRRQDGSENFYRDWDAYKHGFGDLNGEFWLGNEQIHRLTLQDNYEVRIDLGDTSGKMTFALYEHFGVAAETVNYKLSLGTYFGTAGDSFGSDRHRNMAFSTKDRDNDIYDGNCASLYKGGWWYGACHHTNLNGLYHHGDNPNKSGDGVSWQAWRGFHYSLKFTEMKIRPHNFDLLSES
ncbi:fibrinogen C domain-containing protein 1-like [Saccoglossus kowalevskii]